MPGKQKDPRLARAGVSGYNKPKRTPSHPKKSHVVVAKEGDQVKTIRFGEQGAKTAGKPKSGESEAMKKKRASFKARHGKNIAKGKMSAAYWADKVKWSWLNKVYTQTSTLSVSVSKKVQVRRCGRLALRAHLKHQTLKQLLRQQRKRGSKYA